MSNIWWREYVVIISLNLKRFGSWFYTSTMSLQIGVGEFRKTRHPRNIEFNEVLEICFSGEGIYDFQESGTCEASGSRTCDFQESWTCEASGSRTCDFRESWICEVSELWTCESLESRTGEVTNFGGRLIREYVGSLVRKSRMGKFTNQWEAKSKLSSQKVRV
jgi:hypothetical protein